MISSSPVQLLWCKALLLFSLLALVLPAQAEDTYAALVLFRYGNVVLTNQAGSYPLEQGNKVAAGDRVLTGEDGRVQLRFGDGGLVSLMPNSEFAVDTYSQPTAGSEGSVSVKLLKGGLRALSGSIGKKDPDSYQLKTDVATLGIRGTQFIVVMDGDIMRVHVGEGAVSLLNRFGQLLVPSGQHAAVLPGQAPLLSAVAPLFVAASSASVVAGEGSETSAATDMTLNPDRTLEANTQQGSAVDTVVVTDLNGNPQVINFADIKSNNSSMTPRAPTYKTGIVITDVGQRHQYTANSINTGGHEMSQSPHAILRPKTSSWTPEQSFLGTFLADPDVTTPLLVGGLYWAEISTVESQSPGANYDFVYRHEAHVWGDPVSNMPITGTLNYKLAGGSPVRSTYNQSENYQLTKFDLSIELGQSTKFTAAIVTPQWSFNQTAAANGYLDSNSGILSFSAENSAPAYGCYGCMLHVAGFLAGDQAAQAGVSYHYEDKSNANAPINYTGVAVLNRQ